MNIDLDRAAIDAAMPSVGVTDGPDQNQSLMLKLHRPISINGREITEIDMSGIENLNTMQLKAAEKEFAAAGNLVAVNEMSIGYACIIARMATGLPDTVFNQLSAKDGVTLKNMVTSFFFV